MLRYLFLLIITGLPTQAYCQDVKLVRVDTALYAILPYDSTIEFAMIERFDRPRPAALSRAEVDRIESLVDSCYKDYNKHMRITLLLPITAYRRQYAAVVNKQGNKEVWINFFCSSFNLDWKHRAIVVDDGGRCFFQLKIDLTAGKVTSMIVNSSG
jgi:hypothetical protein